MSDSSDGAPGDGTGGDAAPSASTGAEDIETLRQRVEEEYDFDDFGPADMARMSPEEWEAAFDPETWIVGEELLDRVRKDLEARIARREVFAALDRIDEGGEARLAAWSDEGYAVVYPDGTVEGSGTVLRDVKASIALCSMESYEVEEPPAEFELPRPEDVTEGSGEFGNLMLQVVAVAQVIAGLGLAGAWLVGAVRTIVAPVVAIGFLLIGLFLFGVVANARLSDRFRAEEFRDRLRTVEATDAERPEFLPPSAREDDDAPADAPTPTPGESAGDANPPDDGSVRR
ncbi:MAG: hypothetical protein ABEJ81_02570 [Haloferacaceae archaeon]